MIYFLTRAVLRVFFKVAYRFSVSGAENIPRNQPVLVVANHVSYLDPITIGLAMPRRVSYMAKSTLFRIPIFGWYISKLRAFPVNRDRVDRAALRTAMDMLKKGEIVCIFPQGRRSRDGASLEGFPGAAMIAYKTNSIILPAAISGTEKVVPDGSRFPRFPKISVNIGKPIELDHNGEKKQIVGDATEKMMDEIKDLLAGAAREG